LRPARHPHPRRLLVAAPFFPGSHGRLGRATRWILFSVYVAIAQCVTYLCRLFNSFFLSSFYSPPAASPFPVAPSGTTGPVFSPRPAPPRDPAHHRRLLHSRGRQPRGRVGAASQPATRTRSLALSGPPRIEAWPSFFFFFFILFARVRPGQARPRRCAGRAETSSPPRAVHARILRLTLAGERGNT
jgi:hypothetical protein